MHKIYNELAERVSREDLGRRLILQVSHAASFYGGRGTERIHPENSESIFVILRHMLRASGLLETGRRNAVAYRVEEHCFELPEYLAAFDGFTVLHLSDIHADGIPDECAALVKTLRTLRFDLCVMTGDFRFSTWGDYGACLARMSEIIRVCACEHGVYGILGNHDFIEMAPDLEAMGMRMLLNESVPLERDGQRLWLAGVDDPHLYAGHDLPKALAAVPADGTTLLLAHSPEIYREAAAFGVDYLLCGHTHGGQICLPGQIPLLLNAANPRRYSVGAWRSGALSGYTSRGTGSSGLAVRFNCPPEITLHVFRAGTRQAAQTGERHG